jgi:hypothetical protein
MKHNSSLLLEAKLKELQVWYVNWGFNWKKSKTNDHFVKIVIIYGFN